MWTTGIEPLCSSGFVIDKIGDAQFELCCSVFVLQLSSLSELVGVTDPKSSLLLLLPLPTGIVIYSCLLQGSAFGYPIPHTLLPLFLHILLFRQRQVLFPCLLCIMDLMGYISKQINFCGSIIINENIHTVIYNIMFLQHIVMS